ncbi:6-carboxytetrahydropterin synthase QueD [uncultured Veillonella sp.]|uniref:6-carboxytetrahydropterin synthase QueD n=1 Tax=uncultured Veillonella sp. TaxID=159268 RepID=UPI002639FBD6|nr:6-carboxytetrahydropterin synthase QueD [uncultured Veillonella sp.]
MFTVVKKLEISASHQLKLDYESKCQRLHGHNWIVHIYARAKELNHNGMVIDFGHIKEAIHGRLDHRHINDIMGDINPTAENMAKWIADELGETCFKVVVQESEGNVAIYERD